MEIIETNENNNFTFEKVEIRRPRMKDLQTAERIAKSSEGITYGLALVAQVCTFDGKKIVMEDLVEMDADDFLQLSQRLLNTASKNLGNPSSFLQDTQDLALNQS